MVKSHSPLLRVRTLLDGNDITTRKIGVELVFFY